MNWFVETSGTWSTGVAGSLHWIVLLPLLGAAVNGLLGKRLGRANVHLIASGVVFAAFVLSFLGLLRVASVETRLVDVWWHWFDAGDVPVQMAFALDRLSGVLICVVTGVGFLIHLFSTEYMSHDEGYWRYFAYLNLFIAMMSTLVLGANLIVMFVGWEGVGLASYLLIGFWYTDEQKAYAGRKAFVVNRIGDFGFLLGIFTLMALFGTVDLAQLTSRSGALDVNAVLSGPVLGGMTVGGALTLACLLLFLGACGKSAQFPLYVWLPDAMAGPTPVSALIHAATMVTAGVYMVARLAALFALSPVAMAVVTLTGAFTAILAALMAFAQNDIKKVLAYSTVSQLGFMFIGVGVGAWWAGIFHLVTHAFFKACLFLGAGSVMHGMGDETDIRKFGGLRHEMPHTFFTFAVATIAITGVFPLSGFFSKDAILHGTHMFGNPALHWAPHLAYWVGLAAALGTSFYMWRMFHMTFLGQRRGLLEHHAHESGPAMTGPLWVLGGLTVGALFWGLPGEGGAPFQRFLQPVFAIADANHLKVMTAGGMEVHGGWALGDTIGGYATAWIVGLVGLGAATWMYLGGGRVIPEGIAERAPGLYALFASKFYVDEIYDLVIVRPISGIARALWGIVDAFAIDRVIVGGVAGVTSGVAGIIRYFQNGNVRDYAAVMAISAVILFFIFLS